MPKKQRIASILLYHFIGLTVAIGGWLWEALIFLIKEQRFVNRGFLYGPYLPVYGVGAVLLSVFFYQKRITVIITYAHLQHANYPQHFYDSPIYTRLRQLIKHTLRSRRTLPASWIAQQPKKIIAKSRKSKMSTTDFMLHRFYSRLWTKKELKQNRQTVFQRSARFLSLHVRRLPDRIHYRLVPLAYFSPEILGL